MTVKRTYTIAEAAELTGLTRKAIARRLERGSLRSLVRNGRRLVPRSELVRAGLLPEDGAAPEPAAAPQPRVPGGAEGSPEVMLAALMRELLDRLERQGNEIASYRAITAQAESLHLEREVNELRARLLALEGRPPGAPAARPEETVRIPPPPPPQPQPPYAQPPASGQHGEQPLWLPPSAAQAPAPQQPAQHPTPQPPQPAYAAPRSSPVGRLLLFALEAGFIVAVAVAAWLSDLEPLVIIGSVGVAWILVALLEWIRWSARSGR